MSKIRAAIIHFCISISIILIILILVKHYWFRGPFLSLMDANGLFFLFLLVGFICGPFLTFFVFDKRKKRLSLVIDIAIIVVLQVFGVGYSLFVVSYARPVVMVFEVDRIRVLSFAELDRKEENIFPRWTNVWSFSQPQVVFLRPAGSSDEKWKRIYSDMNGQQASRQPSQWIDYYGNSKIILERTKPLESLIEKFPEKVQEIEFAIRASSNARWLPLVSEKKLDWVIFLDGKNAKPIAIMNLDGFF
ncbi:MAG: hypothetical protein RR779_06610 [Comamonas sp.]